MKLLTVSDARPQFIKAAVVSRQVALRSNIEEVIVHTGQHYDVDMSDIFFDELAIPRPDHHLGIGGGTHGAMTGRMLEAIESHLAEPRNGGSLPSSHRSEEFPALSTNSTVHL